MSSVLRSFRLPPRVTQILEEEAKLRGISQSKVIERALVGMVHKDLQWQKDLAAIALNQEYKHEQLALAEENYDD